MSFELGCVGRWGFLLPVVGALGCGSSSTDAALRAKPDGAIQTSGPDGSVPASGPVTVTVKPKNAQASVGGRVQFTAQVGGGTTDRTVDWTVEEATGGTIAPTGEYTAPSDTGKYHVTATSHADATKKDTATITVTLPPGSHPKLTVGTWMNISPPTVPYGQIGDNQVLAAGMAMDTSNPATLYECVDGFNTKTFDAIPGGVYKSTDAGNTWTKMGDLDSPVTIAVDPADSQHVYVGDGVRGNTAGFWVSHDGGSTWTQPQGFKDICAKPNIQSTDTYSLATDPTDFNHVILSFHYGWSSNGQYTGNAGVIESFDGGGNWIAHDPASGMNGLGYFIMFLFNPAKGLGDKNTWLVGTQGGGYWKTKDAGKTWTQVSTTNMAHEGSKLYYANDGAAYVGGFGHPLRSTDNGDTWTSLDQMGNGTYTAIQGDGTTLFAQQCGFVNPAAPFQTSPENDGVNWAPYAGGAQTFTSGPAGTAYDPVNHIIYASMWEAGVWALKTQ